MLTFSLLTLSWILSIVAGRADGDDHACNIIGLESNIERTDLKMCVDRIGHAGRERRVRRGKRRERVSYLHTEGSCARFQFTDVEPFYKEKVSEVINFRN